MSLFCPVCSLRKESRWCVNVPSILFFSLSSIERIGLREMTPLTLPVWHQQLRQAAKEFAWHGGQLSLATLQRQANLMIVTALPKETLTSSTSQSSQVTAEQSLAGSSSSSGSILIPGSPFATPSKGSAAMRSGFTQKKQHISL